jgi:aminobenzoyl-glutamate utilization protein B
MRESMIMKKMILLSITLFFFVQAKAQNKNTQLKKEIVRYIDTQSNFLSSISDSIWKFAEPSLEEYKSSTLLKDILKREGFSIQENAGGFATQFVATYGNSKPVIGLYGEYDADQGASNKTVPYREPLVKDGYGHGGGHNLLGVGSLATALALNQLIKSGKLKCTIKYFGTTAEGTLGGKTYLAREGFFDDLDMSLYWHPSPVTAASTTGWDALLEFDLVFIGKKASLVQEPEKGINALAALELFQAKLPDVRKKLGENTRINYTIPYGGKELGFIADSIVMQFRLQAVKQTDLLEIFELIKEHASGVCLRTGVKSRIALTRAKHPMLTNVTAMKHIQRIMEDLGPIRYTPEEQEYAKQMQRFLKIADTGMLENINPFRDETRMGLRGYASDIGDASWYAPEIYFVSSIIPFIPMHSWPAVAFTAHPIAHKGMLYAAKVMALFVIDYVLTEQLRNEVNKDFDQTRDSYRYQSLIGLSVSDSIRSFRTVDSMEYKKAMLTFYDQSNMSAFKEIFISQ